MNGLRNDTPKKKGKKEDKGSRLFKIDGGADGSTVAVALP